MKPVYITSEGVAELQSQLAELLEQRPILVDRLKTARDASDLLENAEFIAAQQDLELLENRINKIEYLIKIAKPIKKLKHATKVRLGSNITLSLHNGSTYEVCVVSTIEADPLRGKISDASPLGQNLLGKAVGDMVTITTPTKTTTYTVTKIS